MHASSSQEEMEIFVKTVTGKTLTVKVAPHDEVMSLKLKVRRKAIADHVHKSLSETGPEEGRNCSTPTKAHLCQ